jgi:peptidoglycan/xylan/chitin deacetylase (PgdA/CDA1 family)
LQTLLTDIRAKKGGIVLFHDVQEYTVNNLREWIRAVKDEGHTFVPLVKFVPEAAKPLRAEASGNR